MTLLSKTQHCEIHSNDNCHVSGYVIVMPQREVNSLAELDEQERLDLIDTLAYYQQQAIDTLQPERIYCLSFGEILPRLHFHIFPRSAELRERYWQAFPERKDQPIDGPALFGWVLKSG